MGNGIVLQMLILLIIVMVGFIANKCGIFDKELEKKLSKLIIDITSPLLIMSSVMGDTLPDRRLIVPLFIVSVITYLLLWFFCRLLPRAFVKDRSERGVYAFMLMFANVGFMGYPVVTTIFGNHAVFYAALLNMPNTFFIFTVGMLFIMDCPTGQPSLHNRSTLRLLYHPAMIACYISIVIVALRITDIPRVIATPVTLIGQITVPGALLIIGSSMGNIKMKQMLGSRPIYIMTVLRLVAIPIGLFFLFKAFGADHFVNQINAILIGMPVASYGTMFCITQNRDATSMVQGTLITTILSVVSIPLLTLIF